MEESKLPVTRILTPPSKQSISNSELQEINMENGRLRRKLEELEELHTQKGHFIVKLEQRIVKLEEKVVELESQVNY
jgi:predicted  nucleic acid-binding Zn-ribbon protein